MNDISAFDIGIMTFSIRIYDILKKIRYLLVGHYKGGNCVTGHFELQKCFIKLGYLTLSYRVELKLKSAIYTLQHYLVGF